jgi:hypothetical protein
MTTRRRLLVFGLLAGLLALGAGVWLLWPRTAITRENAARIRPGMTLEEVETILGGPMRDDSTGKVEQDWEWTPEIPGHLIIESWRPPPQEKGAVSMSDWRSDQVLIFVDLDSNGRILECHTFELRRAQDGPVGMIRRWLRL